MAKPVNSETKNSLKFDLKVDSTTEEAIDLLVYWIDELSRFKKMANSSSIRITSENEIKHVSQEKDIYLETILLKIQKLKGRLEEIKKLKGKGIVPHIIYDALKDIHRRFSNYSTSKKNLIKTGGGNLKLLDVYNISVDKFLDECLYLSEIVTLLFENEIEYARPTSILGNLKTELTKAFEKLESVDESKKKKLMVSIEDCNTLDDISNLIRMVVNDGEFRDQISGWYERRGKVICDVEIPYAKAFDVAQSEANIQSKNNLLVSSVRKSNETFFRRSSRISRVIWESLGTRNLLSTNNFQAKGILFSISGDELRKILRDMEVYAGSKNIAVVTRSCSCGESLRTGVEFCPKCGKRVAEASVDNLLDSISQFSRYIYNDASSPGGGKRVANKRKIGVIKKFAICREIARIIVAYSISAENDKETSKKVSSL